jgi:hypothetical protein
MKWRLLYWFDAINITTIATGVLMGFTSDDKFTSALILSISIAITAGLSFYVAHTDRKHRQRIRKMDPHQHAHCIYKGGMSVPRGQ